MRKEKGITLIALIITVAIMIILVGVSIRFAIDGGLAGTTQKAAADTQNEVDYENMIAQGYVQKSDGTWVKLSGIGGTSGEGEGTGAGADIVLPTGWTVASTKPSNWSNSVTAITNGTNTIPLPTGFTVSQETGESTYSSGVVIKDSNENEFVWIPYTETYVEEYIEDNTQKTAIENTINKYDGYWIARYVAKYTSYDSTTNSYSGINIHESGPILPGYYDEAWHYYEEGYEPDYMVGIQYYDLLGFNDWNSLCGDMDVLITGIDDVFSRMPSCKQMEVAAQVNNFVTSDYLEWTLTGIENESGGYGSKVFFRANDSIECDFPCSDGKGRPCAEYHLNYGIMPLPISNYSCRACLILN